jgi:hypothetical protein
MTYKISLDDYSSFQYMLAPPSLAKAISNKTTSFVFYDELKDINKIEQQHKILAHGEINVVNYCICCLLVLPSHLLGMSKWISAEDTASSARKPGDELRNFRYSYYWGFLNVDARHILVHSTDGREEQFRLVEFMDCPMSLWVMSHMFYVLASILAAYMIQKGGMVSNISFASAAAVIFVLFHLILAGTGANMLSRSP